MRGKCGGGGAEGHGSIDRVGGDRDELDGTELGLFGLLLVADLQLQSIRSRSRIKTATNKLALPALNAEWLGG